MNYSALKAAIAQVVRPNDNQEITGENLQGVFNALVNSIAQGYLFAGIATPLTEPGTPDQNVVYLAGAGSYSNFGTSIKIDDGYLGIFTFNGEWAKNTILIGGSGGGGSISTIDIHQLDSLNTLEDMFADKPNIYTVTLQVQTTTVKVGTLLQFANNGRYDVAQVLISQYIIDQEGSIETTTSDQEVHIFYRLCKTRDYGTLPTAVGVWTTWTEIGTGGGGVTIDPYPTQNSGNAVSSGGVFEKLQSATLQSIDINSLDSLNTRANMLANVPTIYTVTKTIGGNLFRIGTLFEFANQDRYILYQILATDYLLNDDGALDTTTSVNGGMKLIWRMFQFEGNTPTGVNLNEWSKWSYLSGGSEVDAYTKSETDALLAGKQSILTFDNVPTANSDNPVKSGGVKSALDAKQGTLTFDNTPAANSDNPVKSQGIKNYVDGKETNILNQFVNYYTKSQVDNLIVPQGVDAVPVTAMPATGDANTLYFLQGTNSFTINAWDGSAWVTLATISGTYDAGFALN